MKIREWFFRNEESIIKFAFIIPILLCAIISIAHVTAWYGVSNPYSWAVYLSIAIELAALSSVAALTVGMGRFIYLPFGLVTFLQLIGNVFYSFQYIDVKSAMFKAWVDLVGPVLQMTGIDPTDVSAHKRILSFISGGFLPIISLTFLHMLIRVANRKKEQPRATFGGQEVIGEIKEHQPELPKDPAIITDQQLSVLEKLLGGKRPKSEEIVPQNEESQEQTTDGEEEEVIPPSEELKNAADKYNSVVADINAPMTNTAPWIIPVTPTADVPEVINTPIVLPPTPTIEVAPNNEISSPFTRVGKKLKTVNYDSPTRRV